MTGGGRNEETGEGNCAGLKQSVIARADSSWSARSNLISLVTSDCFGSAGPADPRNDICILTADRWPLIAESYFTNAIFFINRTLPKWEGATGENNYASLKQSVIARADAFWSARSNLISLVTSDCFGSAGPADPRNDISILNADC